MDKKGVTSGIKLEDLRVDEERISDIEGFWENVPEYKEGYILTSRVKGV